MGSVALAVFAYLPDGGLREFWDTTVGYQLGRASPFSLWGLHPSLVWAQDLVKLGAALLAAAVVPLSTAYSVAEAFGSRADVGDSFHEAPLFQATFAGAVAVAAGLVLIPGVPLIPILFLSQALNAALLLVLLPFMRRLARDPAVMGPYAAGRASRLLTGVALALVALSVAALAVLTIV